jgi:hypothetical protein
VSKNRKPRMTPARAIDGVEVDYIIRKPITMGVEDWPAIRKALWDKGFKVVRRKVKAGKRR